MDQPLGTRLAAEALGTFLFFFLGFSGIAVVVDIGAGRSPRSASPPGSVSDSRSPSRRSGTSPADTSTRR